MPPLFGGAVFAGVAIKFHACVPREKCQNLRLYPAAWGAPMIDRYGQHRNNACHFDMQPVDICQKHAARYRLAVNFVTSPLVRHRRWDADSPVV